MSRVSRGGLQASSRRPNATAVQTGDPPHNPHLNDSSVNRSQRRNGKKGKAPPETCHAFWYTGVCSHRDTCEWKHVSELQRHPTPASAPDPVLAGGAGGAAVLQHAGAEGANREVEHPAPAVEHAPALGAVLQPAGADGANRAVEHPASRLKYEFLLLHESTRMAFLQTKPPMNMSPSQWRHVCDVLVNNIWDTNLSELLRVHFARVNAKSEDFVEWLFALPNIQAPGPAPAADAKAAAEVKAGGGGKDVPDCQNGPTCKYWKAGKGQCMFKHDTTAPPTQTVKPEAPHDSDPVKALEHVVSRMMASNAPLATQINALLAASRAPPSASMSEAPHATQIKAPPSESKSEAHPSASMSEAPHATQIKAPPSESKSEAPLSATQPEVHPSAIQSEAPPAANSQATLASSHDTAINVLIAFLVVLWMYIHASSRRDA